MSPVGNRETDPRWRAVNKVVVVVDGKEGAAYDRLLRDSKIIFDSPDSLHYLVLKDRGAYFVEEKLLPAGPPAQAGT